MSEVKTEKYLDRKCKTWEEAAKQIVWLVSQGYREYDYRGIVPQLRVGEFHVHEWLGRNFVAQVVWSPKGI